MVLERSRAGKEPFDYGLDMTCFGFIFLVKMDVIGLNISNLILIFLIFCTVCVVSMAQTPNDLVQLVPKCDAIKSAENVSVSSNVGPGNAQLTYILSWVNSTSVLDMILTNPSGERIDSSAKSPTVFRKNETMITYIVSDPEAGKWNAEIRAKKVPELGEDFCAFTFLTLGGNKFNETSNVTGMQDLAECETCNQSG